MRCVAFDLGASSGKLFAGTIEGSRLKVEPVHSFPNAICSFSGGLYWDFFGIQREMNAGIRKAAASGPVDSFGVDSFNNDFSLIDKNGELLLPVRSYRDARTEKYAGEIYACIPREKLYAYTGNQLAPFNTFMQLAAMSLAGQTSVFDAADKLLLLPDLLGFSITGEKVAEYTVAAETQFLDLNRKTWIHEIPGAFDVPARIFPDVVNPGTITGRASRAWCDENGVSPFRFVSVCEHDTASAFAAAPGGKSAAYLSSGTWSLVGLEVPAPIVTQESFAFNIANEGGWPGYHRLIKNVMGFWILQELLKEYAAEGHIYSFPEAQQLAREAEPFRFLFDPDAPEFFRPGQIRRKIRIACLASTGCAPETPGEFFRCIYEGLALRYRRALHMLQSVSGKKVDRINILGGGSRDALACQLTADATGLPVLAGPADATAIGNILVQMIALGEIKDLSEGRELVACSFEYASYEPTDSARWEEHYRRFEETFPLVY